MIKLVHGDLFESGAQVLVNAVNTDGVMGKGIALQFRKRFPLMFAVYRATCQRGELAPGGVHIYELVSPLSPQYIVNLATKGSWRKQSDIRWIRLGLEKLAAWVEEKRIATIAIPALGCGNGELQWQDVLPVIVDTLKNTSADILVYQPH